MVVVIHLFSFYGKILSNYSYFNLRLREGGDILNFSSHRTIKISIHASEKEATNNAIRIARTEGHFNPRLREGGDTFLHLGIKSCVLYFNPRLREGGDAILFYFFCSLCTISIHASEKEATAFGQTVTGALKISIHASEKEATTTYCDTSAIMYISSLNNFFVRYF